MRHASWKGLFHNMTKGERGRGCLGEWMGMVFGEHEGLAAEFLTLTKTEIQDFFDFFLAAGGALSKQP